MIIKAVLEIIKARDFINVATCDNRGRPNGVSKLIVKIDGNSIVLVDYTIGRTYANLMINPRVSLSFFDLERLRGYQINGHVEIIERGSSYEEMTSHLTQKEISLSTERVIRGMTRGKSHEDYTIGKDKKFVFFKVHMDEIAEISYNGEINRDVTPAE